MFLSYGKQTDRREKKYYVRSIRGEALGQKRKTAKRQQFAFLLLKIHVGTKSKAPTEGSKTNKNRITKQRLSQTSVFDQKAVPRCPPRCLAASGAACRTHGIDCRCTNRIRTSVPCSASTGEPQRSFMRRHSSPGDSLGPTRPAG